MFYAHSGLNADLSDSQTIREHAYGVGETAASFGSIVGLDKAARLAGRGHDVGKYRPAFVQRLLGSTAAVDHSTAGASIVSQLGEGDDKLMTEIISYCIAGHHAGLPDKFHGPSSLHARLDAYEDDLHKDWRSEIELDATGLLPKMTFTRGASVAFRMSMIGRMIFSCLVDADFRDTEAFYGRLRRSPPDRTWAKLQDRLPTFIKALDDKVAVFPESGSDINRCRNDILEAVLQKTSMAPGLFTLTVPTGGGKTLASLAFALRHALAHGHRRIIYAVPFTSIIDQTAEEFAGLLGRENVLEHHSSFVPTRDHDLTTAQKARLGTEDWEAPVIVTTNVQLFETLFSCKPSRNRKLHNIANSIIVLDEAQMMPRNLLVPCVTALDELARNYGCTIILCTATQPALNAQDLKHGHPLGLQLNGRELAPDPEETARRLNLVSLRFNGDMTNADLVSELSSVNQALVIVNSRRHARELYECAKAAGMSDLYHLSTRQCAADRKRLLAGIKRELAAGQPCRVISTSLIEAGVNVDFERVWKAESGLEQIAQACGRCNRERRRSKEASVVTVFRSPDHKPPESLKDAIRDMHATRKQHDDLLSPRAIRHYFTRMYWRAGEEALDQQGIIGLYKFTKNDQTDFAYRTTDKRFQMIVDANVSVLVPAEGFESFIKALQNEDVPSREHQRAAQQFSVSIPEQDFERLRSEGEICLAGEQIHGDRFPMIKDPSRYSSELGLVWEDA
ncbi:CRISPR-associated helicase Cas3' [Rhizobium laguerreae]|nr:CRISPR-associated helicase Cas3' [Rhizobium laguerreae]